MQALFLQIAETPPNGLPTRPVDSELRPHLMKGFIGQKASRVAEASIEIHSN